MPTYGPLSDAELDSANRGFPIPNAGDRYNASVQGGNVRSQRWVDPATTSTTGIHAAVTDTGAPVTVTTSITQPDYPRGITATAGGSAGDIKAIQVIITGTDIEDNVITETLPAFTVDTAGTVQGSVAFKTVTSIYIPAHDGTGATTAIGFNDKMGFDSILYRGNTTLFATIDGVKETTAPTIVTSATAISGNTIDSNTAMNGARDLEVFWIDSPPY